MYQALHQLMTPAIDTTDLLRAQHVMASSALDYYIHEITRIGMLEVYHGKRPRTDAFLKFEVQVSAVLIPIDDALKGNPVLLQNDRWLDGEIRRKHGHVTFQHPDKIADAIRLFSNRALWPAVASQLNQDVSDVKDRLRLIFQRRNQIAHQTDLRPPQPGNLYPISLAGSTNTVDFIEDVCEAIHLVVV